MVSLTIELLGHGFFSFNVLNMSFHSLHTRTVSEKLDVTLTSAPLEVTYSPHCLCHSQTFCPFSFFCSLNTPRRCWYLPCCALRAGLGSAAHCGRFSVVVTSEFLLPCFLTPPSSPVLHALHPLKSSRNSWRFLPSFVLFPLCISVWEAPLPHLSVLILFLAVSSLLTSPSKGTLRSVAVLHFRIISGSSRRGTVVNESD